MNKTILAVLLSLILTGCASDAPTGKTEAEILYKEAKSLMEDSRYILATEKLNQIKNQYPYSFFATPAELLQADILYAQESYIESAAAYLLFRDFHPKHAKMDYVVYRIAESYFKQKPETFDRDLEAAEEAIKYYRELLVKYSGSSYTKDGKKKIKECQTMIEDKEKYIADFYYKTEVYKAARWRYLDILKNFQSKKLRDHSMKRVVMASFKLKDYEKCITYANDYSKSLKDMDNTAIVDFKSKCQKNLK